MLSSLVDKITAGAYTFVSALSNAAFVGQLIAATAGAAPGSVSLVDLLVTTQFLNQVKIKFISQLIN